MLSRRQNERIIAQGVGNMHMAVGGNGGDNISRPSTEENRQSLELWLEERDRRILAARDAIPALKWVENYD